jgi:hypothetical protein
VRKAGPPAVGRIGYSVRPPFRGRAFTAHALRQVRAGPNRRRLPPPRTRRQGRQRGVPARRAGRWLPADGVRGAPARPDGTFPTSPVRLARPRTYPQRKAAPKTRRREAARSQRTPPGSRLGEPRSPSKRRAPECRAPPDGAGPRHGRRAADQPATPGRRP